MRIALRRDEQRAFRQGLKPGDTGAIQAEPLGGQLICPVCLYARLAMWPARAAAIPVSTGAFGSFRVLTHSKKFCMWVMVPSRKLSSLRTGFWPRLHALAINAEAAAVDLQGCLRAAKFKPAVIDGGTHHALVHDVESGIAKCRLNRVGTIPLLENVFVPQHLRLARRVGLHGPVHHIDPMGEQIGHGATAKIPEPAPVVKFFFAERLVGSGSKP